jgi:transposase
MSLKTAFPSEIPEQTREVVDAILPMDSVCRLLGNQAEKLIDEAELSRMYHREGRGGINPVILSFVLILQFLENLPDRQAGLMVVMRMDWKYALRQTLTWEGFDYSSLCNFRKRLYLHGQEFVIFNQLIEHLKQAGYIKSKRQRTDATHVLGAIERMSRLELVWETLRLALAALINVDAKWVIAQLPPSFVTDHSEKRGDYRLSQTQIEKAMLDAGRDGKWLLAQIDRFGQPDWRKLPEIALLERVLDEQFEPPHEDSGTPMKTKANITACGDVIASPHDADVRYSEKGKTTKWQGYKVQVTETVDDDLPLITDIGIHSAIESDSPALDSIQHRLFQRGLLPDQHYVDRAYCNGKTLASSRQRGVDLRGAVGSYSRKPLGFRLEDFHINLETRTARCPQGNWAAVFNPSSQDDVAFHVRFGKQCQVCPVRIHCTTEKRGRSLELSPYHDLLTQRRHEQQTDEFAKEMYARARIESTICELARKHGLRQSRYRGQHKVQLQAAFAAVAVNLKRLARYLVKQMDIETTHLFIILSIGQVFQQRLQNPPLRQLPLRKTRFYFFRRSYNNAAPVKIAPINSQAATPINPCGATSFTTANVNKVNVTIRKGTVHQ